MVLRNRNFSTAFCSHFYIFPHFSNIFSHVQNAFFAIFIHAHYQNACFSHCLTFVKKCQKMREKCVLKMRLEKMLKNAFWKCTWKKREKIWKSVKMWKNEKNVKKLKKHIWTPSWEGGTWIFWVQFCCSYFAACPTSAGWKSERSSSNRSEVDCADRRSV